MVDFVWHHSIAWPRKTHTRCKNLRRYLLHKLSYCLFCLKFCCHGNRVGHGRSCLTSFNSPIMETGNPQPRASIWRISLASRVIDDFVWNFVAMAKLVIWVENLNDAVKLANPKTMPQNQKLWLCLVYDRSYDNLKNYLIFCVGVIVFFWFIWIN